MGVAVLALAACLVCVAIYGIQRHLRLRHQLSAIHQPRSWPFIGHLSIIKPDPEGFLDQIMAMGMLYRDTPRMVLFWIGVVPLVMIYDPELAKKVFTNNAHLNKSFLYDLLKPWLGNGLLTSSYDAWKPRRKLLTSTFHYDILRNFVSVFNNQSEVLVEQLKKTVSTVGEIPDIFKPVSLCALDIICETSMGQSVNAQLKSDSEYVRAVLAINEIIQNRQKNPLLYPDIVFNRTKMGKEHSWALSVLHSFTRKVIAERRRTVSTEITVSSDRLNFLDLLLEMEARGEIDETSIQEEVDTFMFEGHDTTATAITWAMHMLGCYPDVQEKARNEVAEVVGYSTEIGLEHLAQLKYLECLVKECLRLYPSVPIIARVLGEDLELGGHRMPAGVQVLINLYLIHRDPDNWGNDAEEFNPERFLAERGSHKDPFAFVPFSAGSRNCIGQRFALMELKIVLCWLLRAFDIQSSRRRDQQRTLTELVLRPANGVPIVLTPRAQS